MPQGLVYGIVLMNRCLPIGALLSPYGGDLRRRRWLARRSKHGSRKQSDSRHLARMS